MKNLPIIENQLKWNEYYCNSFNWNDEDFYRTFEFDLDFLLEFQKKINWNSFLKYHKLTDDYIKYFHNYFDFNFIIYDFPQDEEILIKYKDFIHYHSTLFYRKRKFTLKFVDAIHKKINWLYFSSFVDPNEQEIEIYLKYHKKIHWDIISRKLFLSETFKNSCEQYLIKKINYHR